MIKTKGKIKKGKRKSGGAWLIAPDGRNVGHVKMSVTEEDAELAQLVGTDGHGALERSMHSDLDRHGVPREGREVEVDLDNIANRAVVRMGPAIPVEQKRGIDR
jgi:hypothetical protein